MWKTVAWFVCWWTLVVRVNSEESSANASSFRFRPLQKLVFTNNHLYVAGTDTLYKIDPASLTVDLSRILNGTEDCESPCSSVVTTLGVHNDTHIFLCTTRYGQCSLVGNSELETRTISDRHIVTDRDDGTVVHVKATFQHDTLGQQMAIWITSSYATGEVAMAMRDPDTLKPSFYIKSTLNVQGFESTLSYEREAPIQYVYAFYQGGFRFYLKNIDGQSYLGGMCSNDQRFNTLIELPLRCTSDSGGELRYIQSAYMARAGEPLHHILRRTEYNDMAGSDVYLYGVFAKNATSTSTSVCAFGVSSLITKLDEVFKMCHIIGNSADVSVGPSYLTVVRGLGCSDALTSLTNNQSQLSECDIVKLPKDTWPRREGYFPLIYHIDVVRASILDLPFAVNAFYVEVVAASTVALMVSPSGYIKKVVVGVENHRRGIYKTDDLTHLMTHGTELLPSIAVGDNRVYALTNDMVLSVPLQQCHTATSCQICSDLDDPYCGWCALSSSCTTMDQCPNSVLQGHWLQANADGSSGCITATIEETTTISLDSNQELEKLKVTLNEVPEKETYEMYKCCYFGETRELCYEGSKKVQERLGYQTDYLECPQPPKNEIRSRMVTGKDHIATNLTLKVEQMQFAKIELTFYSCSRHTSCTTCADTRPEFSCNWCLFTYTCFNSFSSSCDGQAIGNAMDQTSSLSGSGNCPRISVDGASPQILVPSGTQPQNIMVNLHNRQDFMNSFKCELSWDDKTEIYIARVAGSAPLQMLQCQIPNNISYVGSDQTRKVTLRVALSSDLYIDNPDDVQVEMYKCEKMKETCSECLSVVSAKYGCGWCQSTSSVCQVRELCQISDSGRFLEINGSSCPELEISQISPYRGPVQGGTSLTIKGENLGKSYNEIRDGVKILVDNAPAVTCVVDETLIHDPFQVICVTSEATAGSGHVRVTISEDPAVNAQSASRFSFHHVSVAGLSTDKGPVSGSTKVAIVGENVNIGSNRQIVMALQNGTKIICSILPGDNLNEISFLTPAIGSPQFVTIEFTVDRVEFKKIREPSITDFTFYADSTIIGIVPTKGILSGGTTVVVTGTALHLIQAPRMYLELIRADQSRVARSASNPRYEFPCSNVTQTQMMCMLPELPKEWTTAGNISYGFILDGIQSTLNLNEKADFAPFNILPNPEFDDIGDRTVSEDTILEITGKNFLAIGGDEIVMPMVSVDLIPKFDDTLSLPCNISAIRNTVLFCTVPDLVNGKKYDVEVEYGSELKVIVGSVEHSEQLGLTTEMYIGIGVGSGVFLIIVTIIIIVLRCRLSQTGLGMKKLQDKMNNLEMTVAKECKEAFTELQTDATEMTADIAALHGLPFYEYKQYCMKVLFPTSSEGEHPVTRPLDLPIHRDRLGQGLQRFGDLLYNKTFLLTFIRTLEQQKKFTVRERVDLASYVSVALQPRMEYHTEVLKTLLAELIERTMDSKKDPKILLRRNESVAEKMLSNWFAFLLQKFLKECAGEPLYLLFWAIKQQIDKGPVDAVTADAKYSLSEDKLLRQSIESHPINLRFYSPDQHAAQDPQTVKVLNCDTISQAIDKILDSLYRNVPNSTKPPKDNLVLEWIKPNGERVAMGDEDPQFSKVDADGCKKLVTLQCYGITDNSQVALTPRQHLASSLPRHASYKRSISHKIYEYMVSSLSRHSSTTDDDHSTYTSGSTANYYGSTGDSLSRATSLNNILDISGAKDRQKVLKYHLVKSAEADTHQESDKMISEIYLNRLLFTKGTLQQFVDNLFETIFSTSHRGSALPLAIKYMFDFLDDQALLHSISNPEVIHHWKSNSLPLRFWVNVIKNPDFVFDIHKSNIVDACLTVVAQIFMDSCSLTEHRLGKDSPSSKLLYAKDIPRYRKWVDRYYSDIKSMPAISDQDMNGILAEESRQHRGEFNTNAALYELHQYVGAYRDELMTALREDEFARKDRLADQLESINQLLNC